jgi:hypothetical protein
MSCVNEVFGKDNVRSLERLGWKVTIEPIDPATGQLAAS